MSAGQSKNLDLEDLIDVYLDQVRAGAAPSVREFAAGHPHCADELRELLPTLLAMENLAPGSESVDPAAQQLEVERFGNTAHLKQLGDYRIIREIGRGGMGVVYEAEQLSLGRRVALKVLPGGGLDPKFAERFQREAKAAAGLHHTNIVPVYDVGEQDGTLFYAMQLIRGPGLDEVIRELKRLRDVSAQTEHMGQGDNSPDRSLTEVMKALRPPSTPINAPDTVATRPSSVSLSGDPESSAGDSHPATTGPVSHSATFWKSVADIGRQAAEAVQFAHERDIIHRDIKPANLLLDHNGHLWITDFGLAKIEDHLNLTVTGDVVGTLRYMAPEALDGISSAVSDVYALGITLFELVSLQPAFDEQNRYRLVHSITHGALRSLEQIDRGIPADLQTIVEKACDREIVRRYHSAGELAADLRRFQNDEPIHARRLSMAERLSRWSRRNRALSRAILVISVLITSVAVGSTIGLLNLRTLNNDLEQALLDRDQAMQQSQQKAAENRDLAVTAESARVEAVTQRDAAQRHLYDSLLGEARATRLARQLGYRSDAWDKLRRAAELDLPDADNERVVQEAAASMGDFLGLTPFAVDGLTQEIDELQLNNNGDVIALRFESGEVAVTGLECFAARSMLSGEEFASRLTKLQPINAANGKARQIAFREGSASLLVVYRSGMVLEWRQENGEWKSDFVRAAHDGQTYFASREGDGVFAEIGSEKETIRLYRGSSAEAFAECDAPPSIESVRLSPDGAWCAVSFSASDEPGRDQDRVRVIDVVNGSTVTTLIPNLHYLFSIAFSSDGHYLACGCLEGVAVYEAPEFQRHAYALGSMARKNIVFRPPGKQLAFPSYQAGTVRLWDVSVNREVAVFSYNGRPYCVAFSHDGSVLAATSRETLRIWRLTTPEEALALDGHSGGVPDIAFFPDGSRLATIGKDRDIRFWDANTGAGTVHSTVSGIGQSVAISPDGTLLATGDYVDGRIEIQDIQSQRVLVAVDAGFGERIHCVRFNADGSLFAAGGANGGLRIWKVERTSLANGDRDVDGDTGTLTLVDADFDLPTEETVGHLCFGGPYFAWTTNGGYSRVQNLTNKTRVGLPGRVFSRIQSLAFTPRGESLVYLNRERQLQVWNVNSQSVVRSFDAGGPQVDQARSYAMHLTVSPDGRKVAVSSASGRGVNLWELSTGRLLLPLPDRISTVWCLRFSPNSDRLAVSRSDGTVILWNLPGVEHGLSTFRRP